MVSLGTQVWVELCMNKTSVNDAWGIVSAWYLWWLWSSWSVSMFPVMLENLFSLHFPNSHTLPVGCGLLRQTGTKFSRSFHGMNKCQNDCLNKSKLNLSSQDCFRSSILVPFFDEWGYRNQQELLWRSIICPKEEYFYTQSNSIMK